MHFTMIKSSTQCKHIMLTSVLVSLVLMHWLSTHIHMHRRQRDNGVSVGYWRSVAWQSDAG